MGATCSRQAASQHDALLAAIRDGDDHTVYDHLAKSRLCAQASRYFSWAAQVSALHGASNEGHLGVLQALIEPVIPRIDAGAKEKQAFRAFLNKCNSYGQTPLMLACKNGHLNVVKYLLDVGADPLVPDKVHSRTCLHYAAWNGWAECIELLLSEHCRVRLFNGLIGGANEAVVSDACGTARMVDMRSESGFTPLHFAVSASCAAAVKVLLDRGASLTAEVLQGACYSIWPTHSTPLHIAAAKGSATVVRHILQAQASAPHLQADLRLLVDVNGKRPVDIARALQHVRLEHMLDPAVSLQQAVLPHSHRGSRTHGCPALAVLAGKVVQVALLGQLDMLAWQLRLRDGASAAMPRSLKRQLLKRERSLKASPGSKLSARPTPPSAASVPAAPAVPERTDSQASSDSEDRPLPEVRGAARPGSGTALSQAADLQQNAAAEDAAHPEDLGAGHIAEEDSGSSVANVASGGANSECGVCLDRQNQLLIGSCHHECCYDCAITLVKKTKLSKSSIRCPFCRGIIGSFQLKSKDSQPPILVGSAASFA